MSGLHKLIYVCYLLKKVKRKVRLLKVCVIEKGNYDLEIYSSCELLVTIYLLGKFDKLVSHCGNEFSRMPRSP